VPVTVRTCSDSERWCEGAAIRLGSLGSSDMVLFKPLVVVGSKSYFAGLGTTRKKN
jgi:hypothetical protein